MSETEKSWSERIFDEYSEWELLEFRFPPGAGVEDFPPWLLKAAKHVLRPLAPALAGLEDLKSPGALGLFLGQHWANLHGFCEAAEALKLLIPQNVKISPEILERIKENPFFVALSGALETEPNIEGFEKITRDAFTQAFDQGDYAQLNAFIQGFAKGLASKGVGAEVRDQCTTATPIYQILFLYWKEVEKLKSVTELRVFLSQRGLRNAVLGERKRLEKICERIGLTFRRPGRPALPNSDTGRV